ncbi:unnamed protein product, partial [Didymodactylos carnosus]
MATGQLHDCNGTTSQQNEEVLFDITGQCYYPFWHGSLENLSTCLNHTAKRYKKPIFIIETAVESRQVEFVRKLAQILKDLPQGLGQDEQDISQRWEEYGKKILALLKAGITIDPQMGKLIAEE